MLAKRGIKLLLDKDYDRFVVDTDMNITDRTNEYSFVLSRLCAQPKGRAMDLGVVSGFCIPALTLSEMGFKVTGVDIRKFPLRHKNYTHLIHDPLKEKFPFPDGHFDYAYSISAIEHFGYYKDKWENEDGDIDAVKETARVLKKGGILLLTMPFAGKEMRLIPAMRSYDDKRIKRIISEANLRLEELKVIELKKNEDGNFFVEMPYEEACQKQESGNVTYMISLVKAIKN